MLRVFAADIKSDSSVARRQISFAAGADACGNGGATQGRLRSVADTQRQLGGHVDAEVQHTVTILLMVLRLVVVVVVAVFYYIFSLCACDACAKYLMPTVTNRHSSDCQ